MGIEDRDWYREETAAKNGMRYNKKSATYSAAEKVFTSAVRSAEIDVYPSAPAASDWHWSLKFLLWIALVAFVLGVVRFANYLAR